MAKGGTKRAHLYPAPLALLLLQWLGVIAPSPSQPVLHTISRRTRVEAPLILTLSIFYSLSLSLAPPLAKIFSTKLKCKETLQKFLKLIITKPSSWVV